MNFTRKVAHNLLMYIFNQETRLQGKPPKYYQCVHLWFCMTDNISIYQKSQEHLYISSKLDIEYLWALMMILKSRWDDDFNWFELIPQHGTLYGEVSPTSHDNLRQGDVRAWMDLIKKWVNTYTKSWNVECSHDQATKGWIITAENMLSNKDLGIREVCKAFYTRQWEPLSYEANPKLSQRIYNRIC